MFKVNNKDTRSMSMTHGTITYCSQFVLHSPTYRTKRFKARNQAPPTQRISGTARVLRTVR